MTDRNLHKELMKKSTGAIRETLLMMNAAWTDDDIISKLRQDFSLMSTMNRAREELKDLKQLPGQPISSYMYKYGRIHFLAMGNQAHNERYPTAIMEFIESLNSKLMRALVKKHADLRTRPQMLQQAFNMAERHLGEYWRLNPSKDPAQCGSQVLSTIFTKVNLRSMKFHEGDITTITKVVTTRVTTIKVKMNIMVRRIGTRTPRVLTKRRMIRKSPKTRMCILL